jgi:Family of unknown function (DUF6768)
MNNLDQQIQEALHVASDLPESVEETTLTQDILDTFHGKHRGLMIISWIKMAVIAFLMCFSIYQFFQQDSIMAMIAYATATLIFTVSAVAIMLFLWIKMNHNTTTREIKRLELQVALLLHELRHR